MGAVAKYLSALRRDQPTDVPDWLPADVNDGPGLGAVFSRLSVSARVDAAQFVAAAGCQECVPALLQMLGDQHAESAWIEGAKALQVLQDPVLLEALSQRLKQAKAPLLRQMLVYATMADPPRTAEVAELLLSLAANADEADVVRGQALEALAHHHPGAVTPQEEKTILACLDDESADVAFNAAWAAGIMRIHAALPRLDRLARSDRRRYNELSTVAACAADAKAQIEGLDPSGRAV